MDSLASPPPKLKLEYEPIAEVDDELSYITKTNKETSRKTGRS